MTTSQTNVKHSQEEQLEAVLVLWSDSLATSSGSAA